MQIQLNDQVRVYFDRPRRRSENEVERPFSAMLPHREPPINMLIECRFCQIPENINKAAFFIADSLWPQSPINEISFPEFLDFISVKLHKIAKAENEQSSNFIKMLETCAKDSDGRTHEFTFCDGQNTVIVNAFFREICSITSKQDVLWGRFIVDKMPDFLPSYFEFHLD